MTVPPLKTGTLVTVPAPYRVPGCTDRVTACPRDPRLAALRAELIAAGWTAESPAVLDAEGESIAFEERLTED